METDLSADLSPEALAEGEAFAKGEAPAWAEASAKADPSAVAPAKADAPSLAEMTSYDREHADLERRVYGCKACRDGETPFDVMPSMPKRRADG